MATHSKPEGKRGPKTTAELEAVVSQHVSGTPTKEDNVSDTPTKEDIVRQPPTLSDKIELVRVNARIAKTHRDRLEAIAREDGRLLSDVVREAIRDYLRRR